jgi:hypothetical protein
MFISQFMQLFFNIYFRYTAIIDNKGNCCFGIGEMNAFTKINKQFLQKNLCILENTSLLVMDGNPSLDAMKFALDISLKNEIPGLYINFFNIIYSDQCYYNYTW